MEDKRLKIQEGVRTRPRRQVRVGDDEPGGSDGHLGPSSKAAGADVWQPDTSTAVAAAADIYPEPATAADVIYVFVIYPYPAGR